MNWEIGIDIYTLICIKWITNKNLLYKKINKIKFKYSKKKKKRILPACLFQETWVHNFPSEVLSRLLFHKGFFYRWHNYIVNNG